MIIRTFGFHKKFAVNTNFLDETIDMEGEVEVEKGETWEQAVLEGRRRMIALVESYHNQQVPSNKEEVGKDQQIANTVKEILSCKSQEQLNSYRMVAAGDPSLRDTFKMMENKLKKNV